MRSGINAEHFSLSPDERLLFFLNALLTSCLKTPAILNQSVKSGSRALIFSLTLCCITHFRASIQVIDLTTNTMHRNWSRAGIDGCCVTMRLELWDCVLSRDCQSNSRCLLWGAADLFQDGCHDGGDRSSSVWTMRLLSVLMEFGLNLI